MIGGWGWRKDDVKNFLGSDVYTIPCGSVRKGDDPHGRIVHNYSYAAVMDESINSALLENSVRYISFKERVEALSQVSWYIAVDLKEGYRQMALNPRD